MSITINKAVQNGFNLIKQSGTYLPGCIDDQKTMSSIFSGMQLDKGKNPDFNVSLIKKEMKEIEKKIEKYEKDQELITKGKKPQSKISSDDFFAYRKELGMLNKILSANTNGNKKITADEFKAFNNTVPQPSPAPNNPDYSKPPVIGTYERQNAMIQGLYNTLIKALNDPSTTPEQKANIKLRLNALYKEADQLNKALPGYPGGNPGTVPGQPLPQPVPGPLPGIRSDEYYQSQMAYIQNLDKELAIKLNDPALTPQQRADINLRRASLAQQSQQLAKTYAGDMYQGDKPTTINQPFLPDKEAALVYANQMYQTA